MTRFRDLNEPLIEQPRCKTTGCQHNRNPRGFTPQVPTCGGSSSSELTAAPLLLRLDGDNDAIENIAVVEAYNEHDEQAAPVHYVTTWNPRQQSPEHGLAYAEAHGHWSAPRAAKRVALFAVRQTPPDGDEFALQRLLRVIRVHYR